MRAATAASLLILLAALSGPASNPARADTGQSATILEQIRYPFQAARRYVIDLFAREEKAVEADIAGFVDMVRTDASAFALLVRDSGYELSEIDVGAELIPSISLIFSFVRPITAEERAALDKKLDRLTGVEGAVQRAIILGLLEATETVYDVRADGFELSQVQVDAGLIPGFTFIFTPPGN